MICFPPPSGTLGTLSTIATTELQSIAVTAVLPNDVCNVISDRSHTNPISAPLKASLYCRFAEKGPLLRSQVGATHSRILIPQGT